MTNNQHHQENTMTSSRNIIRQENQHDIDNNYNNIHTEPGVLFTCEDLERIKDAYVDNISDRLTGAIAAMIEKAMHAGLTADEIIMAIEETGFAPYPSPRYLQKILENWAMNGVTVSRILHEVSANKASPWWKCEKMPWHR